MGNIGSSSLLVIGGGIGGLSVALRASQEGKDISVLEQALEFSEVGAGLQLAPNALAVLDKLGVYEDVKKIAVFPKRVVFNDAISGEELTVLDVGQAFVEKFGYPYCVVHRSDLLNVLLKACQKQSKITLLTNKRVIAVSDEKNHVSVKCLDGTSYHADAVIGADGLKSQTRKLVSDDELISEGYVAYRGTVPIEEVADFVNLDDLNIWMGPDLHYVQYPVRNSELLNQVAVFKSKEYKKDSDDWGTAEELDDAFSQCCEQIKRGLGFLNRSIRWAMYDREPIRTWTNGKVTLLGDAAHPMYQYLAQGACQALEDADRLIDHINTFDQSIESALISYEKERTLRTAEVQRGARIFGNIMHASDPATVVLRNKVFSDRNADDYSAVEWLYGYALKYQKNVVN